MTDVINDLINKKCQDLTEEQQLKRAEYKRNRRANMTEEQRLKISEYCRKRSANRTEEERLKRAEYYRKRYANRTEEERKRRADERRKMFANRTEEERLKQNEYQRKRHAKITEEERLRRKEYYRKRRANLTEEKRMKRIEYDRQRQAIISEERKRKWIDNATNKRRSTEILPPSCLDILTEGQFEIKSGYDPLKKFIERMINNSMDVEIIPILPMHYFQGILRLIGIDCTYKRKILDYKSALQNLICEIDVCYLIELLKRWEGWIVCRNIKRLSYDALFNYVKTHFFSFKLQREAFLLNELNNLFNSEHFISVTCSYKQLQSLFYHSPQNYVKFYPENIHVTSSSDRLNEPHPKYIIYWPHVSTRIALPNFSMTHQNDHFDEFILLNITHRLNIDTKKSIIIEQTTDVKYSEKYMKSNIIMFLNRLKSTLINKCPNNMATEKKNEIILALTMFEIDLSQCPDVIESNYKHSRSSVSYPYSRYLGYSDDSDVCVSMSDQKAVNDYALNVRLQQIRYPNVAFVMEKFNVVCEEPHYAIDESFMREINTCITYSCLLCDEFFGYSSPTQIISDHFTKYHGFEPDWECTKCRKSFTNDYLLNNDWKHDCE